MTVSLLILAMTCGAEPTPAPKAISAPAVNKVDETGQSPWVEITADPILTTLASPAPSKWVQVDDGYRLKAAADGKTAVFAAPRSGRYRLVVVPEQGDPIRVAVVVGKVDPPPPKPDEPPPPPPPPVSDLGKRLQAAFDTDPGERADKLKTLGDKVELYKQAAVLAADPAVTSLGALVASVKAAADALHTGKLPGVRKVIRGELSVVFPADAAMTAEVRAKAAITFQLFQSALREVK